MADDRSVQERVWAAEDAAHLPPADLALWQELKIPHRVQVFEGRRFVIWKALADGTPKPVSSLHVVGVQATFARGLELEVLDATNRLLVIPQHPVRVFEHELFLWLPYFNDVGWMPHPHDASRRAMRLSIVMRMRSHPRHWEHGHTYISDVGEFRANWPAFAGQKF